MRVQAFDRLDAERALMFGLVRQHRRAGDIADGIDSRHIGPAQSVVDDHAALGLNAEFFEPETLAIADDANGRNDALGSDRSAVLPPSSMVAVTLAAFLSSFRPWHRSES